MKTKLNFTSLLIALSIWFTLPASANVPTPPAPPAVPAGSYCSTIYQELQGYLDTFNQTLGNPAPYPQTVQFAQLQMADSNAGPALSNPNYLAGVIVQVQQLKAMGFQGVKVEVAFPVLYQPFYGSAAAMQPYLTFYQNLAQAIHGMGMQLLVENNVTLSLGTEAGWSNVAAFYATLDWPSFIAARSTMAGTVAQYMQPEFLMLSEEPDNEAVNAGQPNLNNPNMAASMIAGEIVAARAASLTSKLGAGFGTWLGPYEPNSLMDYTNAYLGLPLDYLDMHIYPINTEYNGLENFLSNALTVYQAASTNILPRPVAISESWPWKMEDKEFNVLSTDTLRARDPFSFWAPIDVYFIQTMEKLANYTQMLYLTTQGNDYFMSYQTYGGTTSNGGAANCTCTTASCSDGDITATENSLAINAAQASIYTTTAFTLNSLLVSPVDATVPTDPASLAGTAGFNSASLQWNQATDNIGVAGYNVYRCSTQPCTAPNSFQWIANTAQTNYYDVNLNDGTTYEYQVQAFDMAGNVSQVSNTLTLTTALSTPPTAPQSPAATPNSPKQITVTWTPPQNNSGLGQYLVYGGADPNPNDLVQIAQTPSTSTSFKHQPLTAATTYCYAVVAVEKNLNSPMSPVVCATTLPLPNAPSSLSATSTAPTKVSLTWKELVQPGGLTVANYQVYEGTVAGVLTKVATTTATSYTAQKLLPNTTYYFAVMAVDTSFDNSPMSDEVTVTTLPMPNAPINVTGTATSTTKLTLNWQWTQGTGLPASRYLVNCGLLPLNPPQVGTSTKMSYTYTAASPNTVYFCNVVAVDTGNDNSTPSQTITVTTPSAPNAPNNVQVSSTSGTKFTVSWQWNQGLNGLPAARYQVNCGTSPNNPPNIATTTSMSYTYTKATPGTTYYCDVVAVDTGNDNSAPSNIASVTTPPPPNAPSNVVATVNSSTKVTVTWTETLPQNGLPVNSYKIYRSTTLPVTINNYVATRTTASYVDTTVTSGKTYYYAIAAVDSGQGTSALSSPPAQANTP